MKTKTTRELTVCSAFEKNSSTVLLKGKWFRACGFNPGDTIELDITKKGKIVITNKGNRFKK